MGGKQPVHYLVGAAIASLNTLCTVILVQHLPVASSITLVPLILVTVVVPFSLARRLYARTSVFLWAGIALTAVGSLYHFYQQRELWVLVGVRLALYAAQTLWEAQFPEGALTTAEKQLTGSGLGLLGTFALAFMRRDFGALMGSRGAVLLTVLAAVLLRLLNNVGFVTARAELPQWQQEAVKHAARVLVVLVSLVGWPLRGALLLSSLVALAGSLLYEYALDRIEQDMFAEMGEHWE